MSGPRDDGIGEAKRIGAISHSHAVPFQRPAADDPEADAVRLHRRRFVDKLGLSV